LAVIECPLNSPSGSWAADGREKEIVLVAPPLTVSDVLDT
jgi:hypothetical protein